MGYTLLAVEMTPPPPSINADQQRDRSDSTQS